MTVLIIDNYDSFTYNLYQYLGELGHEAIVHRNDQIDLEGVQSLAPDHIVLSPGPGTPERERDFGVCRQIITELSAKIPTLGVCLGHQGIIHHLGGRIVRAPHILHGKTSIIKHTGHPLFHDIPEEFEAMRYHSLLGERDALPECLELIAESKDDRLVMAVRHKSQPLFGIQFHPESIGTPCGKQILQNFINFGTNAQ